MKNKIKLYLTLWIILFAFLSVNAQYETVMKFFKDDIYTSKELVDFVENDPQKAFDSWKLLYNKKTGLTKNVEELSLIAKNIDGINKAGGYLKWKSLRNTQETGIKLLGEAKIKYISGLTTTENSIIYTEGNKIIDKVAVMSKSKQSGAGSILVRDSKFTSAVSNKNHLGLGDLPEDLHPLVKDWFKNPNVNAEELTIRFTHGKCAEPEAVSKWLYEYEQETNIKITAIDDARDALKGTKSIAFENNYKVYRRKCK
ncbi:hypothetical protein IUY40_00020 [Flavobacterium sp. ALJ2]|uniref:YwqJ-related putative deaminase n=1 Tax=Flavobacterium sp. ALJ2 TaxID=2786960 RepID=UPI00189E9808|nr:YwqJ-related putative deaminase [Flavobacterium sp. ALJ2]MBF7089935.1 hypothetical protein [Flavobacterium sp. ALJ2]